MKVLIWYAPHTVPFKSTVWHRYFMASLRVCIQYVGVGYQSYKCKKKNHQVICCIPLHISGNKKREHTGVGVSYPYMWTAYATCGLHVGHMWATRNFVWARRNSNLFFFP